MTNLANVHLQLGKPEAALPLYEQAVGIRRTLFGEEHPQYADSLHNLALRTRRWAITPLPCPSIARP